MIFTLLFWIFSIVSDFSKFYEEVKYLKNVLKKKYFPSALVDKCIKIFLNKQFSQKILEHTVPKEELFIVLPYLGMSFLCLITRLQKSIRSNISYCVNLKLFLNNDQHDQLTFSGLIIIFLCVYSLISSISLRVVDVMLPITAKFAVIWKLELLNTQVSHLYWAKGLNPKNYQLLKTIWWSATNQFLLTMLKCLLLETLSFI